MGSIQPLYSLNSSVWVIQEAGLSSFPWPAGGLSVEDVSEGRTSRPPQGSVRIRAAANGGGLTSRVPGGSSLLWLNPTKKVERIWASGDLLCCAGLESGTLSRT